ncbi:hypothetical protein FHS18_004059 [Paenibacillus phyllosphaerae]|uniref:Uncharacterized protein n=1 Tax=Paenibacillus phyllosphaerae TaxID=274593 RepID=A0A7W5B162_9BACL|nr:hypothetical protein [Paenibacillus phyllosphaerae]MBB3111991.1 hypothetical protein [Paenibacillus phyllosphaerae]
MLTPSQIKRKLKEYSKEELIELLYQTVKANKEARTFVLNHLEEKSDSLGESKTGTGVVSFAAMSKWLELPEHVRELYISNVWCGSCSGVTTIKDYNVQIEKFGIVLRGKCAKCEHSVARVVED